MLSRPRSTLFAPILIALIAVAVACGGTGNTPPDDTAPTNDDTTPILQDQRPVNGSNVSCSAGLAWDQAIENVGDLTTVTGSVVGTRYDPDSEGQPTYLYVGKDFPEPDRFMVVIWGDARDNFPFAPEVEYNNRTICVTGRIVMVRFLALMVVDTPGDIEIVDLIETPPLGPGPSPDPTRTNSTRSTVEQDMRMLSSR